MLGLAIYNSVHLTLKFPKVVFQKLLDLPPQLEDIEEFEPELFNTLKNIRGMKEGFEAMGLTFSLDYEYFGAMKTHELVVGGADKPVTSENKEEFVQLYVEWICSTSIQKQFENFYRGFYKVMTRESIKVGSREA